MIWKVQGFGDWPHPHDQVDQISYLIYLTRLTAREDYIKSCRSERPKSEINTYVVSFQLIYINKNGFVSLEHKKF
jgi:hypothetical protein